MKSYDILLDIAMDLRGQLIYLPAPYLQMSGNNLDKNERVPV